MRAVPPVYSPITLRALVRGVTALGAGRRALATVEDRLRDRYGTRGILLTNSGTSALTLALRVAARLRPGPVALPAYGCYDLLTACHGAGSTISFYDVSPHTLGPDPRSLATAVSEGASAVVIAYLYGFPVDIEAVRAILSESAAVVIEDAAQGVGGLYRGDPLGSHGDLSVLSFARGKGRTGGGGGALLTASTDLARALDELRDEMTPGSRLAPLSRAAAQWAFGRPGVYAVPRALPFLGLGSTHYREPGRVAGMPETAAMMLASCWDAADGEAERRSRNAIEYARRLCVAGLQPVAVVEGGRSGYLRYPVLASRALPESLVNRTTRSGVSGGYPVPLPLVAPRPSDHAADRLEGAAALASRLITLPTHGLLRSVDMDRAAAVATAVEAGGSP